MKTNHSKNKLKAGSSVLAVNSAEAVKALQKTRLTQGIQEQPDVPFESSDDTFPLEKTTVIHLPENVKSFLKKYS